MQSPAHRIPESASGKYCDQGNLDDDAYGQYDGGPRECKIVSDKMVDQKFNAYTENGNAPKQINGIWQKSMGYLFFQQRK